MKQAHTDREDPVEPAASSSRSSSSATRNSAWPASTYAAHGKRLFAGGTIPGALKLVDTKTSSTGVAIHAYERAGELQVGSFALEQ